ncbi:MAG: hypothetical protein R3F14_43240 [Polyangiaceae bacterium]
MAVPALAASLLTHRVNDQVRKKLGASYGFHASTGAFADRSVYLRGRAAVDNAHAPQALAILKEELAALSSGVDTAELDQTRWTRTLSYAVAYQSTTDLADELLELKNLGLPTSDLDQNIQDVLSAPAASVTEALRACANAPVIVVTGDESTVSSAQSTFK